MKFFASQFSYFIQNTAGRRQTMLLMRFLLLLAGLVTLYSVLFHVIMLVEGQTHSWLTGFYWTLTVMSTLGFGDITFHSDLGRVFSIVVLLSGMLFLLVLLPFTFIEFFYAPWMKAQSAARAPRELPADTAGHLILTHYDAVTRALIARLDQYRYPYALVIPDLEQALQLHDEGLRVIYGEPDDPKTYRKLHADRAAMVVASGPDPMNCNVAFTVRELSESVPIVTTADTASSVDILQLAGSTHVLQLGDSMGRALARHSIATDARAHLLGRFGRVCIAEATAAGTPLAGKTLAEIDVRVMAGLTVAGLWKRGAFLVPRPDTRIDATSVLLLAGTEEQIERYNELFCIYHSAEAPVLIIGGGRVGRAAGKYLAQDGVDYRIVEERADRVRDPEHYIVGSAAEIEVLERAGLRETPTVIVTPHDDDTNIYLTLYCRKLRPDVQIIARASLEKNVSTLHRAGADFVMSYASMGANSIFNQLKSSDVTIVAEGLSVFPAVVPAALAGRTLADLHFRAETGCSVLAVRTGEHAEVNPSADMPLPAGAELLLIGRDASRDEFFRRYLPSSRHPRNGAARTAG